MDKSPLKTKAPVVITGNTTVLELVEAGVIKITQLQVWNKRLERKPKSDKIRYHNPDVISQSPIILA